MQLQTRKDEKEELKTFTVMNARWEGCIDEKKAVVRLFQK